MAQTVKDLRPPLPPGETRRSVSGQEKAWVVRGLRQAGVVGRIQGDEPAAAVRRLLAVRGPVGPRTCRQRQRRHTDPHPRTGGRAPSGQRQTRVVVRPRRRPGETPRPVSGGPAIGPSAIAADVARHAHPTVGWVLDSLHGITLLIQHTADSGANRSTPQTPAGVPPGSQEILTESTITCLSAARKSYRQK